MKAVAALGWRRISIQQWALILSATVGYGLYYVCRLSLSVAKTPLVAEGVMTEAQIGFVGSALFYTYAVGKFVNGFLADRISLKCLFTVGLVGSAACNLVLGSAKQFPVYLAVWTANGWFQSMGAPACVVGITRWFQRKQRGTFYGLWSSSHNLGEGLTFVFTSFVVGTWGWQTGFRLSAAAGGLGVAVILALFRDPAKGAVRNTPDISEPATVTPADTQRRVLRSPLVWCIALASSCMYVTRYAINSWGVFYLHNAKGYSLIDAGSVIAVTSICGVMGTVAAGWISDVCFGGNRFKPAVIFAILNVAGLTIILWSPVGARGLDFAGAVVFGISIGALVCFLGGLLAVDAVPKQAAGAALGIVGIASYLGAGTQDIISGWLIGRSRLGQLTHPTYNFGLVKTWWLAAGCGAVMLTLIAQHLHRPREIDDA